MPAAAAIDAGIPAATGTVDIAAVFTWLHGLDIETLDTESLTDAMCATRPLRGWLDVIDARLRARDRQLRSTAGALGGRPAQSANPAADGDRDVHQDMTTRPPSDPPVFDRRPIAGAWSADSVIDSAAGVTSAEARRRAGRSIVIERFPELEVLLTRGRITNEHIEVIARAIDGLPAAVDTALSDHRDEVVAAAGRLDCVLLRRSLMRLINRLSTRLGVDGATTRPVTSTLRLWHDRSTGHGKLFGQFDPHSFQCLRAVIDAGARSLTGGDDQRDLDRYQLAARSLLVLLGAEGVAPTAPSRSGRTGAPHPAAAVDTVPPRVVASISVIVDADTLVRGVHDNSVCEYADGTPIDWGRLRQLACAAELIPIVVGDGGSLPLDVGRRRRLATDAQHRALEAVYATCAIRGCDVPVTRCELHHIDHWENGGPTDLDNLIPLCSNHHHRLHEQGWELSLGSNRVLSVRTPNGAGFSAGPDRLIRAGP